MILKVSAAAAVVIALLASLYAVEQLSQKATADASIPYSRQATTTPISSTSIKLRLYFDTGRSYDATQCEGGMVRVEGKESVLGLSPYMDGNEVKIKVYKVFRVKNQEGLIAEGLSEINEVFLIDKVPVRIGDERWGLGVEVVNIQKPVIDDNQNSSLSGKSPNPVATQAAGQCCITCPPEPKVCAGAVQAPCGDCCVGGCPNPN